MDKKSNVWVDEASKELIDKSFIKVTIDGNEIETKGLFTNWENAYVKEPVRSCENRGIGKINTPIKFKHLCQFCKKEFEYGIEDVRTATVCEPIRSRDMLDLYDPKKKMERYKEIRFLQCPHCKEMFEIEYTFNGSELKDV